MICKKQVISWFKDLESYKRIDMMCTLLNMCLPFELRFLGTCLEELGRRDSQELRGIELRVNNPQDLSSDMLSCQKGEPTDKKIRRKMALYLALIRACNRSCVTEIFRTLDEWGTRHFYKMNDLDTLQELLLVYTMAANHPVFSFEQHMKCSEIFEKIKSNMVFEDEQHSSEKQVLLQSLSEQNLNAFTKPQDLRLHITPTQQEIMSQQHTIHAIHLSAQQNQIKTAPLAVLSQGSIPISYPNTLRPKVLTSDVTPQYPVTLDSIPQMMSSSTAIPSDKAIPHTVSWTLRPNLKQYTTYGISSNEQPPHSSSPILSQQSSPSSSRTTSPSRSSSNIFIVQSQKDSSLHHVRNMTQRDCCSQQIIRRPSLETTAQAIVQKHQQITNEIPPQNIDDVLINTDGSMSQLQSLIRNGFGKNASHHRNTSGKFLSQKQLPLNQQYQVVSQGHFSVNSTLAHSMHNLSLTDKAGDSDTIESYLVAQPQNAGAESDSGSSIGSCGENSRRETPELSQCSIHGTDLVQPSLQTAPIVCFNAQINAKVNEVSEKIPVSAVSCSRSNAILYDSSGIVKSQFPSSHQQFIGTDQVHTTVTSFIQSSSSGKSSIINANNPNSGSNSASTANIVSANNKILNTILMSSPSNVASHGILGNIVTSNSLLNQQYNTSYPYYVSAPQHLTSAVRSSIISHNSGIGPPPPGSFRLPAFQIPPNGEIIYPGFHSTGIAYISNGPVAMPIRTSTSSNVNLQLSNTSHSNLLQHQKSQIATTPNAAHLAASPYTSLTAGLNKPISCYNCGSQSHNGRDCHEASMDDVTRNAVYKLDYSVSSSNASPADENQTQSTSHSTSLEKSNLNIQQKQNIISLNNIDVKVLSTSTPSISP